MGAGLKGWRSRWSFVEHLVSPSLEAIKATNASIGLVKPKTFELTFTDESCLNWTTEQKSKLQGTFGAQNLFGGQVAPATLLQKLPVKIRYKYTCSDSACGGHEQLFEDWEVGQSWRSWSYKYPTRANLEAKIREKYVDVPKAKDNLFFFVGTMALHRESWLVIGHAQPLHLAAQ